MSLLSDDELHVEPEPTLEEWRARCLLAQSLVSHRLDTTDKNVSGVLAVLRGDLTLDGM